MRHAFRFPTSVRKAVRAHVRQAVEGVPLGRFRQEPAYTAGVLARLNGFEIESDGAYVSIEATNVDDRGAGAAEGWSGADLVITATVRRGAEEVRKAILVQAKRGTLEDVKGKERERLTDQVRNMCDYTRSPKVIVWGDGTADSVRVLSGRGLLEGTISDGYAIDDYFVCRVLPTLDGDTRPGFVATVQNSSLQGLRVLATLNR